MRFRLEKIFEEEGKRSASAVGLATPMHVSVFEIPEEAKVGDIVDAGPIKRGGGCAIFYNFRKFDA